MAGCSVVQSIEVVGNSGVLKCVCVCEWVCAWGSYQSSDEGDTCWVAVLFCGGGGDVCVCVCVGGGGSCLQHSWFHCHMSPDAQRTATPLTVAHASLPLTMMRHRGGWTELATPNLTGCAVCGPIVRWSDGVC